MQVVSKLVSITPMPNPASQSKLKPLEGRPPKPAAAARIRGTLPHPPLPTPIPIHPRHQSQAKRQQASVLQARLQLQCSCSTIPLMLATSIGMIHLLRPQIGLRALHTKLTCCSSSTSSSACLTCRLCPLAVCNRILSCSLSAGEALAGCHPRASLDLLQPLPQVLQQAREPGVRCVPVLRYPRILQTPCL